MECGQNRIEQLELCARDCRHFLEPVFKIGRNFFRIKGKIKRPHFFLNVFYAYFLLTPSEGE